jgi:hypothetical protein
MVACQDDKLAGPADGTASLSIYLTDAQGEVEAVWVQLLQITARGGEGGPVDLLSAPTELILLTDLVGTVHLLTSNMEINPSTLSQLRLVVGNAVLLSKEGLIYVKGDPELPAGLEGPADGELHCPSCSQSGIKVKVPNDEVVVEEGDAALVLDFDVAQSFGHKAGNSGKWVMHPVIHGTLVGDDVELANSITGTVSWGEVTPPICPTAGERTIGDFIPTATINGLLDGEGQPIVRSGTVAEDEKTFKIGFLPSGSYAMGFVDKLTLGTDELVFTGAVTPTEVTVDGADVTGVVYTIQSATCQVIPPAG